MPETAMNEYGQLGLSKYQIRTSWEASNVKPVSDASGVQPLSQGQLWERIFGPYPRHAVAALFWSEDVCHGD